MSGWIQIAGWTLIHFVWQGVVLAMAAAGALRLCRHRSANTRYAIACVVLAAMLAAPVVTAGVVWRPTSELAPLVKLAQAVVAPEAAATALGSGTIDLLSMRSVVTGVGAWLPVVVFAWLTGVVVLLVRMAGGLWRVRGLQVTALAMSASRWQAATDRLASRLGLPMAVHVVESRLIGAPTAVGWLRPVILIPIAALANLTPSQVEAILAHELVHIRRHDYVFNVMQTLAETLLFYHPGVWWVSGRIRAEREHCCDDVAVAVCGDAVDYATALAELEAWRARETTLALAATTGSLSDRVRRILRVPIGHEPRSLSWVVTLGLTLVLGLGVGGFSLPWSGSSNATSAVVASAQQRNEPIAAPDTFDWQVYTTSHFDMHYYAALTDDLERVEEAAERAYQWVSSELRHNLAFKVPLILFKTRDEFERQEVIPGASMEWVSSFSEPERNRIVFLLEDSEEEFSRRITHELTHIFAFDIVPRSSTRTAVPVWIDEGLADYMAGAWQREDLIRLREIVAADSVPRMTTFAGSSGSAGTRDAYILGRAAFEFIEARHGKAGVRQFLLELRRNVIAGTGDLYQAALYMTPDDFDEAFTRYLKDRFPSL